MKICKNNILDNFPFLEDDFDALTDYDLFSKLYAKVLDLEIQFKKVVDDNIKKYIETHFNNMMVNYMYDSEEEKLILYLDGDNNG